MCGARSAHPCGRNRSRLGGWRLTAPGMHTMRGGCLVTCVKMSMRPAIDALLAGEDLDERRRALEPQQAIEAAAKVPCGVADVEVVAEGVERDVDVKRPPVEEALREPRDQAGGAREALPGPVEIRQPRDEAGDRRGLLRPPEDLCLLVQLGLPVSGERAARGALRQGELEGLAVDSAGRATEEQRPGDGSAAATERRAERAEERAERVGLVLEDLARGPDAPGGRAPHRHPGPSLAPHLVAEGARGVRHLAGEAAGLRPGEARPRRRPAGGARDLEARQTLEMGAEKSAAADHPDEGTGHRWTPSGRCGRETVT